MHWVDGKQEDVEEDYSPWVFVKALLAGRFTTFDTRFERDGTFDVTRVIGPEHDLLWAQLFHGVQPIAST